MTRGDGEVDGSESSRTNDTADHPAKQIKRAFASSRNSLLVDFGP
jgi:hypothetical protein